MISILEVLNPKLKSENPQSTNILTMAKNIPKIADRPKERKPNKPLSFDFNFTSLTQSEQFKFVAGVLFMLVAAFMFISFFSHLFTGNTDQSEIDAALANAPKTKKTANPFGLYGAKLSHLLIFELFGWSAFLLIPILFVSGFKMSFKRELIPLERLTWQALFYMFWFSCFFGFFVFMLDAQATLSNVCGGIGYFINQSLYGVIGWASILVIMFVLVVFFVYYYGIDSVSKLSDKLNSQTVLQEADNDDEEEVLVEKDIANAKNIQRVRQDLQTTPIIEEELEDLTIDHVDNHDEENIRPYLPPVVSTPTNKGAKGEISLTIENAEDIPETIEEEDAPIILDEKDAVNESY